MRQEANPEGNKILCIVKLFGRKYSLYNRERAVSTLFFSVRLFLQYGERIYATLIQNYFTIIAVKT